jgi:hypothetical protein
MKKMLLAFVAAGMLLFSSCSKDDDEDDNTPPPSLTKESLAGNYKLTGLKVKLGSAPEIDYLGQFPACEVDDIYNLKTDFTYAYIDAGTKCNPPGDDTGVWGLPGNNKITLDGQELNVDKWDGKELHATGSGTDPNTGQSGTVRFEFTRQ